MIAARLESVGRAALRFFQQAGEIGWLACASAGVLVAGPFRHRPLRPGLVVAQAFRAGNQSLPLIALVAVLMGMIMALHTAYQLRAIGAMDLVPGLVAVSMTRELAPLMTAIVVAGRYGSAIAAELGTMKMRQELDALTVMGIELRSYLILPRLMGLGLTLPAVTVFATSMAILAGLAAAWTLLGMHPNAFLSEALAALALEDLTAALIKALLFAAAIGLVSCHQGLATGGSAEDVGRATTSAVVRSIVLVIGVDLVMTAWLYVGD